jgi:hypothetical protein
MSTKYAMPANVQGLRIAFDMVCPLSNPCAVEIRSWIRARRARVVSDRKLPARDGSVVKSES